MNGKLAKRLRVAAVRHYMAHNAGSKANPALVLKRTYKLMKREYKATPYCRRAQRFPLEGHSELLKKILKKIHKKIQPEVKAFLEAQA